MLKSFVRYKSVRDLPKEELLAGGTTACMGCGSLLGLRLALKALGKETIVVNASGCMTLLPTYPLTPFKVPFIHGAIENAAAVASGIARAFKLKGKKVNVLCYAGDGATYDIGFQALSGAIERQEDIIYVCYNNEAYSNTGEQRSSATPRFAWTTTTPQGKKEQRKPLAKIVVAHKASYVATACVSFPLDYMNKLLEARSYQGVRFIDLLCPCPTGWRFDPSKTIEIGRLAVKTGAWILFEVKDGRFKLSYDPNPREPVKKYLLAQGRFKHLKQEEIKTIQSQIDKAWEAIKQGRFWEANY